MSNKNYTELFSEFLELIGFDLIKTTDEDNDVVWKLKDAQYGNLGDIEDDEFYNAEDILGRLDMYVEDYLISDLEEIIGKNFNSWEDLLDYCERHRKTKRLLDSSTDIDTLDMILNHADEVDLEKVPYTYVQRDDTGLDDDDEPIYWGN